MPVVINEFEVVTEPAPPAAPADAPRPGGAPEAPRADLARVLADAHARALRVRAY